MTALTDRARELADDFVCQQNLAVKLILPLTASFASALQRERDEATVRVCRTCSLSCPDPGRCDIRAAIQGSEPQAKPSKQRICPNCGTSASLLEIQKNGGDCPECGYDLSAERPEPASASREEP